MLVSSGPATLERRHPLLIIRFALMVVSMRGDMATGTPQMPMGRAVRGIFESIGVPHTTVDRASEACDTVRCAGRTAFGTRTSLACLLPRRVTTGS
jgi:sulfopyruvate decarboxylase TPP-binding subunit